MIIDKLNIIINTTDTHHIHYHIAKVIKDNMNIMPTLSISLLAEQCHVSKSMISKFSKELGYESYIDLKEDCYIYKNYISTLPMLEYEHSFIQSCYCYIEQVHEIMRNIIQTLDWKQFDDLICDMSKAQHIYLYGNDKDSLVCQKIQKELDSLRKSTTILSSHINNIEIHEHSLFIVIFTCDEIHMDNQAMRKISQYHHPTWLITTHNVHYSHMKQLQFIHSQITIDNSLAYLFVDMIISRFYQMKVHKL